MKPKEEQGWTAEEKGGAVVFSLNGVPQVEHEGRTFTFLVTGMKVAKESDLHTYDALVAKFYEEGVA